MDEFEIEYPKHVATLAGDLALAMAFEDTVECQRLLVDVTPEDLRKVCMLLAFGVAKKLKDASTPLGWTHNSAN